MSVDIDTGRVDRYLMIDLTDDFEIGPNDIYMIDSEVAMIMEMTRVLMMLSCWTDHEELMKKPQVNAVIHRKEKIIGNLNGELCYKSLRPMEYTS